MSDQQKSSGRDESQPSLTSIAMRGSAWLSLQAALNKLASAASMFVVSGALLPEQLSLGALVVSIVNFLTIFPPVVMCDVLVAHQSALDRILRPARRLAAIVGGSTAVGLAVIAWILPPFFPEYPATELALLVSMLGFRAWADALSTGSLARLRSELRYKRIVVIDGAVQLSASILTLILALAGAGASAIVLPYLVGSVAKTVAYGLATRGTKSPAVESIQAPQDPLREPGFGQIRRDFRLASLAQYVHTAVGALPMLALGILCTDVEGGAFSFAALLAVQATTIVAYQLGVVLQPIFGRLTDDPVRQTAAYVRAIRTLGFVAVPLAALQAALAAPLFALLFSPKWDAALPVFQILCLSQCFQFGLAPTLSLIKSQARFRVTFLWQITHLAVGIGTLWYASRWGAVGVAIATTTLWAISIPLATWLAGRPGRLRFFQCMRLFIEPWFVGLPSGMVALLLWWFLAPYGTGGQIITLVVGPLLMLLAWLALMRVLQPDTLNTLGSLGPIKRLRMRVSR